MKNLQPWFFENSKLPAILSKVAPISIWAIALGPFVFCKGLISPATRRHETIHFQQQLELLFIGFYILYVLNFLYNLAKTRNGSEAYRAICFEKEAYANELEELYLQNRRRFAWIKYLK